MTSMISDYPKSIPPVVPNFGWYYGTQPLASRATIRQNNLVPNPSFDYDTAGLAPAGWSNSGLTTALVQSGWSANGSQSLRYTTPSLANAGQVGVYINGPLTLPTLPPLFPAMPGQSFACSLVVNVLAIVGTITIKVQLNWYNNAGTFLSASTPAQSSGTGVQSLSGTAVAPAHAAGVLVNVLSTSGFTSSSIDAYVDKVLFLSASSVPAYADGDSPGWSWSGAPGYSVSINQKDDFVTPLNQIITFDAIDQQGLGMPHIVTPTGVSIVDYKWDFGNGQVAHGPFASTTYNYSKPPPDMQVSLTVTDSHGRMYSCAHRLNLQALTPTYATTLRERG